MPPKTLPPGLTSRRLRTLRYVQSAGPLRGGWLSLREVLGARGRFSLPRRGSRVTIRPDSSDILVWNSVFVREEYGVDLPRRPRTIVDAGAYIGLSSIYFAEKYPDARIIALEPEASNFELLALNTKPYPNIVPLNRALWSSTGQLQLGGDAAEGHWAFHAGPATPAAGGRGRTVEAISPETLIEHHAPAGIDLLKLDVEGAEKTIFEHAGAWLDSVDAIFVELHDRIVPGCTAAFDAATAAFRDISRDAMTTCVVRDRPAVPDPGA